jgi:hypothetical protein
MRNLSLAVMNLLQRLFLISVLLLSPAALHAQDKGQDPWPDGATVLYLQENGVHRRAWMAPDEVAIFRGKTPSKAAAETFVNDVKASVLEKDILFMNSFISVIPTTKLEAARYASPRATDSILRQAAPDSPGRPISPVFYPQGQSIPSTSMALTDEIIVRFVSTPSVAELNAVEKNFDLTLARSVTPTTFLYQAATPWLSLEKANALKQSGMVGEAIPHWYRARSTAKAMIPMIRSPDSNGT